MKFSCTANIVVFLRLAIAGFSLSSHQDEQQSGKTKPNIVFVFVDDQDIMMQSLQYMPVVQKHLAAQGVTYLNHFATTALCCPARVSALTGRLAHNTNVTDVNVPHGGYPKFVKQGLNEHYLPVWLQGAGYSTYYTGKLFNAHSVENYDSPAPAGWTNSDFLLDPGTYSYMRPIYQRKGEKPIYHENRHTMELLISKAMGFLDEALTKPHEPFFLAIAPPAPHSNIADNRGIRPSNMTAPIPLREHEKLFPDVKIPRGENFNPDEPSGASWIRDVAKQSEEAVKYLDHYYRSRLQALQSIELLVDNVISRLAESNRLDNTFVIYTSDNGYHIGQHRLPPGKECGFEEDIRVPFFIRGPGLKAGAVERAVTTHVDLAPTIFRLAGIPARSDFDGSVMPLAGLSGDPNEERASIDHVMVEYWGIAVSEGEGVHFGHSEPNPRRRLNNTYKAVRVLSEDYNLYYSVWCNGDHELYDLRSDPGQMRNLYRHDGNLCERHILGLDLADVISRLDALMMVVKSCKGWTCRHPWKVLHPAGDVDSLLDALHMRYDAFYRNQVKVSFVYCDAGYIIEAEGPQEPAIFRDGLEWHHWT
ncbi:Arylsulphatase [Thozetella sp. PMI_491]|nr:Arylsulphatase [Thozetella sp. PMI_491]